MDPSRCRVIQTLPPKHLAVCARGRRCCCTVQKPRLIEFIAKQFLADSIAVRLTKVIDAPTPIRPNTKLFWAGSPTATNWKRQPRPACYENGRHRRFDSPRAPSAPDLQEGHVCFFLNEKLSKGKIYLVAQGPTKLAPSGSWEGNRKLRRKFRIAGDRIID